MKPLVLLSILLALTVFMGCKKDPQPLSELEKLPAATQEGKNTFGCLVDGKAWVTKSSIDATAFYQMGILSISAGVVNKDFYQGIQLNLFEEDLQTIEYLLNIGKNDALLSDLRYKCRYNTTPAFGGSINITHFDQSFGKWIISGTFEFEAYSEECQKTVKITDGRFDLNYAP